MLEEITHRDVDFRQAEVSEKLSAGGRHLDPPGGGTGRFCPGPRCHDALEQRYGTDRIAALTGWRQRLTDQAAQLKSQAEQRMADAPWREAEQLSRRMEAMWPDLPGTQAMRQEIGSPLSDGDRRCGRNRHAADSISLDNWSARRTGRLTERTLFEFNGAGPEGGQYLCEFGTYSKAISTPPDAGIEPCRRRSRVPTWMDTRSPAA